MSEEDLSKVRSFISCLDEDNSVLSNIDKVQASIKEASDFYTVGCHYMVGRKLAETATILCNESVAFL